MRIIANCTEIKRLPKTEPDLRPCDFIADIPEMPVLIFSEVFLSHHLSVSAPGSYGYHEVCSGQYNDIVTAMVTIRSGFR